MKILDFIIECDQCKKITKHFTRHIPDFHKEILKTFWCQHCLEAQVVKFKFVGENIEITQRLEPSDVYVPRKPDTGITIRPRQKRTG